MISERKYKSFPYMAKFSTSILQQNYSRNGTKSIRTSPRLRKTTTHTAKLWSRSGQNRKEPMMWINLRLSHRMISIFMKQIMRRYFSIWSKVDNIRIHTLLNSPLQTDIKQNTFTRTSHYSSTPYKISRNYEPIN
jgi:hypothetical protein